MGYDKYHVFRKQVSLDSGATWNDVIPIEETPSGESIGSYSTKFECEGRPVPPMYTWRQADNEFICEGAIKYYKQYKMVSTDGGTTWQNVSPAVTRPGDIKHYGSAECLGISATTSDYLTLYAVDDCVFGSNWGMAYSIDGGEWVGYDVILPPVEVPAGHTIRIKKGGSYGVDLSSDTSGRYIAYGNLFSAVMDIDGIDWDTYEPTVFPNTVFRSTHAASGITDASRLLLPPQKILYRAYEFMFNNCVNMVLPPELPATTLGYNCYDGMFHNCTSLEEVPILPATTLANNCYNNMFQGCTSLKTLPNNMLPATTLTERCYGGMFNGCTSLTSVPSDLLPATTLADYCYISMFEDCISLNVPPALPATTLAEYCYESMFRGCITLSSAPALPATTLMHRCYCEMFAGCRSLTKAPDLSAETLVYGCYLHMFRACYNLTELKCLATSEPSDYNPFVTGKEYAYVDWLKEVYAEGVIYKKSEMSYWEEGTSQIPWQWSQVNI